MSKPAKKTNVMRVLETHGIPYRQYEYDSSDNMIDGVSVARMIGQDPERVFKTIVTVAKSRTNYVFVLPVNKELDLKKAAKAVGEKSVELIPVKTIEPLTGYIKGGCSPIGMKKQFATVIDETALLYDNIIFNAGRVGAQVEIDPRLLERVIPLSFADITED
ncbi:MAG: Cys-tRNA(Pro) deacylase [Burkholderiales bacterium]